MGLEIQLTELPYDPALIRDLVTRSRLIIRANRNRSWGRPLGIITDDIHEARNYLEDVNTPVSADFKTGKYLGYCWLPHTEGAAIWVRPRYDPMDSSLDTHSVVCTMAHEVAHVITSGGHHGHVWRRAYALILPLWLSELHRRPTYGQLRDDISGAVIRYARRLRALDQIEEVNRHLSAVMRCRFYQQDDKLRFYSP